MLSALPPAFREHVCFTALAADNHCFVENNGLLECNDQLGTYHQMGDNLRIGRQKFRYHGQTSLTSLLLCFQSGWGPGKFLDQRISGKDASLLEPFSEKIRPGRIHDGDGSFSNFGSCFGITGQIISQIFCHISFRSQVMTIFSLHMTLPQMEKSEKLEL